MSTIALVREDEEDVSTQAGPAGVRDAPFL